MEIFFFIFDLNLSKIYEKNDKSKLLYLFLLKFCYIYEEGPVKLNFAYDE